MAKTCKVDRNVTFEFKLYSTFMNADVGFRVIAVHRFLIKKSFGITEMSSWIAETWIQ